MEEAFPKCVFRQHLLIRPSIRKDESASLTLNQQKIRDRGVERDFSSRGHPAHLSILSEIFAGAPPTEGHDMKMKFN